MRTSTCFASAMALALVACGSGEKGGESSGILGGGSMMQAGEWEMTIETVNVSAPNLPPAALAQMKQAPVTTRTCMSEEEAKGPKPDTFTGNAGGSNCKTEGFSWADGKVKGTTICTGSGPGAPSKMTMTMDGEYDRTSMTVNMKNATEAQGMAMTMDIKMTGKRVGDCPAGKENT